ncbi:MAG: hypothetical protein WCJ69_15260 [Betaproteobacteria bacterium]
MFVLVLTLEEDHRPVPRDDRHRRVQHIVVEAIDIAFQESHLVSGADEFIEGGRFDPAWSAGDGVLRTSFADEDHIRNILAN